MALVNGTLPFMQLTEAGLPPSCAGVGARLTLMLMMMMMIETMMMMVMIMMMIMIMTMLIMMTMAIDHGAPKRHFTISSGNKQTNPYFHFLTKTRAPTNESRWPDVWIPKGGTGIPRQRLGS